MAPFGRQPRDIVVIGASAGGVQALRRLTRLIRPGFPGSIFIVLHRSPYHVGALPYVLGNGTGHDLVEPEAAAPIVPGRVYLAPRDLHLEVEDGFVRVTRGPKEHFTRPAVDPLFRSAAAVYGPRVAGVLLTGGGHDGLSGLIAIKEAGGVSIVQDPSEADAPSMPTHAICEDDVDAVLTLDDIGVTIPELMQGAPVPRGTVRRA